MYMTPAELRAFTRLFAPLFKSYGWLLAARSSELVVNSCNSMVINLNTWLFSGERLSGFQQPARCALPCPCSTACTSRNRDCRSAPSTTSRATVCRSGIGATLSLPAFRRRSLEHRIADFDAQRELRNAKHAIRPRAAWTAACCWPGH